jgi:hypothetical protein
LAAAIYKKEQAIIPKLLTLYCPTNLFRSGRLLRNFRSSIFLFFIPLLGTINSSPSHAGVEVNLSRPKIKYHTEKETKSNLEIIVFP